MQLKPFFCYYGGKWRSAPKYPAPRFNKIVEPFAGSAGYSVRYSNLAVELYEVDEIIYWVWHYLINVTETEILNLPLDVSNVNDFNIPQEAKYLIGFWLQKGVATPTTKPTTWMKSGLRPNSHWGEVIRNRIALQLKYIRHWKIHYGSYDTAPNVDSTWFIDPPYQSQAGKHYYYKFDDYTNLGKWCLTRKGQVIVCEQSGANWLPFKFFECTKATPRNSSSFSTNVSMEMIWRND